VEAWSPFSPPPRSALIARRVASGDADGDSHDSCSPKRGVLAAAGVGGHDDLDGFLRERALGGAAQAGDGQRRGAADDRAEECASHGPFLTTAASIVASGIMPHAPRAADGPFGITEEANVKALANVLTGLVALSHIGFLVLEMFFWDHPVGRRIFGMTPEVSASSAALAANQGLYNGFLAAGLLWALWADRRELKIFFLGCVGVAGVFGGLTAKASIPLTQALPAGLALGVVVVASRRGGQ